MKEGDTMSNKLKKEIKNKHIEVDGAFMTQRMLKPIPAKLEVIITNDNIGKTISINNGDIQFTIPFEPLEEFLK